MKISLKKRYKTRDGRRVRIYAVDGAGRHPVHGALKHPGEGWLMQAWRINGLYTWGCRYPIDLIEVKPRKARYKKAAKLIRKWMKEDKPRKKRK